MNHKSLLYYLLQHLLIQAHFAAGTLGEQGTKGFFSLMSQIGVFFVFLLLDLLKLIKKMWWQQCNQQLNGKIKSTVKNGILWRFKMSCIVVLKNRMELSSAEPCIPLPRQAHVPCMELELIWSSLFFFFFRLDNKSTKTHSHSACLMDDVFQFCSIKCFRFIFLAVIRQTKLLHQQLWELPFVTDRWTCSYWTPVAPDYMMKITEQLALSNLPLKRVFWSNRTCCHYN